MIQNKNDPSAEMPSDSELLITRTFAAPRALVFDTWTDPQHVVHWWGPDGFTLTTHFMEVKENSSWRFTMHGPDGRDYENKIIYVEVKEPERLVYRHSGDEGVEPVRFHVTVTFTEHNDTTELSMHMQFATPEDLKYVIETYGADKGAVQTIGRLAEFIESLTERV